MLYPYGMNDAWPSNKGFLGLTELFADRGSPIQGASILLQDFKDAMIFR